MEHKNLTVSVRVLPGSRNHLGIANRGNLIQVICFLGDGLLEDTNRLLLLKL